ncbi:putative pentatricopeptide repeat-containing protein At3g11460, mitochondrial [Aegilops tauschii subsp. strangulata]|uniref:putative pentatricopeptide repeat-containing protein At3g11460, mitochondrial n=1 Tax=Aegilops tauschii subsp. strangulata TaxID=200361 RepID=UPI000989ECC1|nr:putative pentatricopeptide repeat-containing protein At3g11460, mitochondrial [Aegilops tauschii subsp. strangulata]
MTTEPSTSATTSTAAALAGDANGTEPWSARVRTLSRLGRHREVLALLRGGDPSPPPHALALPAAVISCTALSLVSGVAQIQALGHKRGLLPSSDAYLLSSLLSSYSRLGLLPRAHQLLDEMPLASTPPTTLRTAFNSLISGCALHALPAACFALFRRMRAAGAPFDAVTLMTLLPAAPHSLVPQLHALAGKAGLAAETNVANCLISAYARRGAGLARQVFDEMPLTSRDIVSWNAVLSAHAQNGLAVDALDLYSRMCGHDGSGVEPDAVTLVGVLSSCAHLGARGVGLGVERYMQERLPGFRANMQLCNSLINFHARCGSLPQAQRLFNEMPRKSIVSWTALITGYGMHGHGDVAVNLFQAMVSEGIRPDNVAMVGLLSACSHAGMYEEGRKYFSAMESTYQLRPTLEHYTCMVDLLGRAGRLKEAQELISSMPMPADGAVWGALLGACKIHKNVEIGEEAFEHVIKLEPSNVGYYVLMANIYTDTGQPDGVVRVRAMMRERGLKKEPGCSYVEHKGRVHLFMADDHSHPQAKRIYELVIKLEQMVTEKTDGTVENGQGRVDEGYSGKMAAPLIGFHSEKLAVAFGMLNTDDSEIVVIKNLRICGDCHSFLKAVSAIVNRAFLVRDASRFHRFEGGACSCKDYW